MKILLAEDDELIIKVLERKITKDNIGEVTLAKDGRVALECIKNQKFDLIITDMMMPYLGGLEIIHYVRDTLKLTTPIIVLSAADLDEQVMEAFEAGADDFMSKPFNPNELAMRIKKLMIRRTNG